MRDEWFIRGRVQMTKSEVRAVSLSKLELYPGCVLWDIGAGTGSISVEAALSCPDIRIAAIEYRPEAVTDSAELPQGGDALHCSCGGAGAGVL